MISTLRPFSRVFLSLIAFLLSFQSFGQQMALGDWRIHLPYRDVITLSGGNGKIFCATVSGLFEFSESDNTALPITKVNGLSDITINTIAYNQNNGVLVVGYKNANVDLIRGNEIINLPDIKRSTIVGNKTINSIYFIGNNAYLACGFGIVVIDLDRNEIKDTYLIGPGGSYINVYNVITDGTTIFASTYSGIYRASLSDPNLASFTAWSPLPNLPNGSYSKMAFFAGKLVVTFYGHTYNGDRTYAYDLNLLDTIGGYPSINSVFNVNDMEVMDGKLHILHNTGLFIFDNTGSVTSDGNIFTYGNSRVCSPNDMYLDTVNKRRWIGDKNYGLVKNTFQFLSTNYYPNGPGTADVYGLDFRKNNLLVATGGKDDAWNNVYNRDGFFRYQNQTWFSGDTGTYNGIDSLTDILACAIDPDNADHFYIGSWGNGLVEFNGTAPFTVYNTSNSTLQSKVEYTWVGIGGIQFDKDGNVWVVNSHTPKTIQVHKADGTWKAFDFSGLITSSTTVGRMTLASNGYKWVVIPRSGGILVFNDNGTIDNISDDKKKKLGFTTGTGKISGTDVRCITEDKDGEIWVGTDKGICVFYSPENVFNATGFDAQQILIEQDGHTQILLETQVVTAIAIDGANRKWIGTESGGVFVMSEDGTKQVYHFEISNSPLLSNTITDIAINGASGEVFIGTDKGIVSYLGEATDGGEFNENVYAFPNPVRHDYDGPIAIRGVVNNAIVKITDVRGNIVSQMTALGGQAVWDGKNFKGDRVASGVYYALITNEDGTQKTITKILFIN